MNHSNHSKVILITGCSSGFGLLTAAGLSFKGHIVFATMRNLEKKQPLLDEVRKRGGDVRLLRIDVTDIQSIREAVNTIKNEFGRINILVNNAGYGIGGFFEDLTEEEIRQQFDTNFFSVQNMIREVVPLMRERREGKIINISSIAGLYALPSFGAYNASKWALEGFSESLHYELKPFGIYVCLIEPGTYNTTIFHGNKRYAKNSSDANSPYYLLSQFLDQKVKAFVENTHRDPEDIARLVEKIIDSKNPPLRNMPDSQSKMIYCLKRILPFRIFSGILARGMFAGFDLGKLKKPQQ